MKRQIFKRSTRIVAINIVLLSLMFFAPAQAAEKYWSYTSCGNDWWDYNCWSATFLGPLDGTGQPLDGDNVYLHNASSTNYQVSYWNTAFPTATLNSLSIDATGTGSMTLYQSTYTLQTYNEIVGDIGTGDVFLSGGIHNVTNSLVLGGSATGNGSFSVSSAGSLSAKILTVGNDGTGVLNVNNGGTVTTENSSHYIGRNIGSIGAVSITDAGSSWTNDGGLFIGDDGTGTLSIENGGSALSGKTRLGSTATGQGTVTISGVGSSLSVSGEVALFAFDPSLLIGRDGTGDVVIENGGLLTSSDSYLGSNETGVGTVTVTGNGSTWNNTGTLIVGLDGTGTLSILDGASVTSDSGRVGGGSKAVGCTTLGGPACIHIDWDFFYGDGTAVVDGIGSTWVNTNSLSVYNGTLSILNGGSVSSSGLGLIGDGNVNGSVIVDGAGSIWASSGLNLGTGSSLDITNGGAVDSSGSISGGSINVSSGGSLDLFGGLDADSVSISSGGSVTSGTGSSPHVITVDGTGSSWVSESISVGGSVNVINGATVTANSTGNPTHLTVDGAGSTFTSDSSYLTGSLSIANNGTVTTFADATITAGATVLVDGVGSSWNAGSILGDGSISIENGASVTTSSGASANILTVIGTGSTWTNNGVTNLVDLQVLDGGHVDSSDTFATGVMIFGAGSTWVNGGVMQVESISITNGGSVSSANTIVDSDVIMSGLDTTNLSANWDISGSITVNGQIFIDEYAAMTVANTTNANGFIIQGGSFETGDLIGTLAGSTFDSGSFVVNNTGPAIDISGVALGNTSGGSFSMVLPQETSINHGASLVLHNNSSLTTDKLINNGVVSGYGSVNGVVNGGENSTFTASGGDLVLGDASSFSGFRTTGLIDVGSQTVTLNSMQKAQLGYQTDLAGGNLVASNGVFLGGGNAIVGHGNVNASVAAQTGSTIYATGNLSLGDINQFDGFYSQGNLSTNEHVVTINDKNEGVLGSLTTLGNTTGAGTLQSSNGLLMAEGSNLVGHGTVNGDFINQGHVEETGPLAGDTIEFTGNVSGMGDYAGDIIFSGTFNPGNSPGLVSFEDITFGLDSVLNMEIGGLFAGTEYDVLEGTTGSTVTLAGTLDVDLYDLGGGLFSPVLGDSFDIITAESLIGEFDLLTLAVLGDGLGWKLDYLFDEFGTTDIVRLSVVSASTVPVPPAVWLFGSGLLGLVAVARRKPSALYV